MKKNTIEMIDNSDSLNAEAYRTLRSNILFSNYGKKTQSIVVTSTQPSEGKSTTSLNLAIALAQVGKRVLLIDADLRKPSLYRYLALSNEVGLSSVLTHQKRLKECTQLVELQGVRLHVLTSGPIPPNPAEMLNSDMMSSLLTAVSDHYDFVILDTPPVLAVTDSQILSTKADSCLLVIDLNMTKRKQLLETKRRLENVQAHIIGIVANRLENTGDSYYYYY